MIFKIRNHTKTILIVLLALFILSSCKQIVVKLEKIPKNTPLGADIYITGNFNLWDPGDETYILEQNPDSSYFVTLPTTFGRIEYKFTRGDWTTVEKDRCGNEKGDRYAYTFDNDTIINIIESWSDLDPLDCDSVTIVLSKLPENTPKGDEIKIAGNFNAWNPGNDSRYKFKKDSLSGKMTVAIPRSFDKHGEEFRYKIVRNDISRPESDKYGNNINKRILDFEKGDTTFINVEQWEDLTEDSKNSVTIVLDKIPKNTPKNDNIFLVGNFNNWFPGDINYVFRKNKNGIYLISIPRKKYGLSFKITRGTWKNEAANKYGFKLNNLDYNYDEIDTIHLNIENWVDLAKGNGKNITIVITKTPAETPQGASLYLACNYDNWKLNRKDNIFSKNKIGRYYITIPWKRRNLEFKVTRGSMLNQEVDAKGNKIKNRIVRSKFTDTVFVNVAKWNDIVSADDKMIIVELKKVPSNTPKSADIYIVGGFNEWDPVDKKFKLRINNSGKYTITMPERWLKMGFKFTRGSWKTVEADIFGDFIGNRVYQASGSKLYLQIDGWEDK
ncbi:MAG: hypothetical protein B6I20_01690 [Bacteroidetes bacterium 4572_117]|nr:MAG: hypothetical protein B6I20_01690 [Bacteroidetes bacterium 4572_117]